MMVVASGNAMAETLPEAVQYMLSTHPDIRATQYNYLAKKQEVEQARARYYPTLDFNGSYGFKNRRAPVDESTNPEEYTLSLRQNVYDGELKSNEVQRHEARVLSTAFYLQGSSENIALKASEAYLNVLRQLELHELAKENLTIHDRIYDQIKMRSDSGVDFKANLDHIKGRQALAQSNVIVTEINLNDAKTNYQAILGRMPENLVKPQGLDKTLPATLEDAEQLAVANHPILKSADADLEARRMQYESAKSPYLPIVDLEADKRWTNETDAFNGFQDEIEGRVRLRYNFLNGGKDKARRMETFEQINEAQEIRNHTHRQVIESIRLSWMAHKAAQDKTKHLEEYVQATSSTSEAFTKQWNIGKRTMLDVLDTEAEVVNAKKDLINAKYDGTYAQCRILNGTGTLVHALGLEWPGERPADLAQDK
ncbi:MAG: hypothetical protein A2521_16705 [Deltaproteobacteria bacterium RIFOXYD12_FULL_57_12]|nr:MAG: hypothetical protein A2521_16705 [Deltaproteobacteria bacterium RIFOXYD12_FULL_57_12]